MKRIQQKLGLSMLAVIGVLTMNSCSEDSNAETPAEQQEFTATELSTILETEDTSSAVDTVLAELFAGGQGSAKASKSNDCYTAEYTDTGYTATFNNCVLNGSDNINGTLVVTYGVDMESATFTATYADFYVGTIKINGTRTYVMNTNTESNTLAFTVTSNISIEMEDESIISEDGTKTFSISFGQGDNDIALNVSGEWTVTVNGDTYAVATNSPLVGNFGCVHFVSGTMDVSKNGLEVTVDFGDGACDNKATVIYPNGAEKEIELD